MPTLSPDTTPLPSATFFDEFVATMPAAYRAAFDDEAMRAHAAIVERRASSASRVEVWRELPERTVALCVVADDAPGLLSRVSATMVAHDIDVVSAQAYCRTLPDRRVEAVDLFWVRKVSPATGAIGILRERDVASFGETLDALVRGRASFDQSVRFATAVRSAAASPRVHFERDDKTGETIITVHAEDSPGLLLTITRALYSQRLQIVRSEVTTKDRTARDRFHLLELDGAPLRRGRLLAIQTAVLSAIGGE